MIRYTVIVCHMSFQQQCNHPAKLKGNICSSPLISKVWRVDTMLWESSITYKINVLFVNRNDVPVYSHTEKQNWKWMLSQGGNMHMLDCASCHKTVIKFLMSYYQSWGKIYVTPPTVSISPFAACLPIGFLFHPLLFSLSLYCCLLTLLISPDF